MLGGKEVAAVEIATETATTANRAIELFTKKRAPFEHIPERSRDV
jgi:hypothetical protein